MDMKSWKVFPCWLFRNFCILCSWHWIQRHFWITFKIRLKNGFEIVAYRQHRFHVLVMHFVIMEQQFDEVRIITFWWDIVVSKKLISVESTVSTWQWIQHTACHFGANSFHCSLKRSLSLRAVWNFDCCCDFETEVWTLWVLSSLCAAGPSNWHLTYPSCGGSAQSPVNIDRLKVVFSGSLTTFDIPGYETIPRGAHWQLHNNGHTGWCITQCWIQDWLEMALNLSKHSKGPWIVFEKSEEDLERFGI